MSHRNTLMEKELHRWSYMTRAELSTRLNRITKREKLDCFIQVADDSACVDGLFLPLLQAGQAQWERLFGEPHTLATQRAPWRGRVVSSVNRRRELSNSTEDDSDVVMEFEENEIVNFETTTGRPKRVEKKKKEKPFVPPIRIIR